MMAPQKTQTPKNNADNEKSQIGVYQSPLHKLFSRQQPRVKAKKGMARLLLTYAENDSKRIAQLLKKWIDENN